jgi:DNA polymerase III epsilon subunit-like protein
MNKLCPHCERLLKRSALLTEWGFCPCGWQGLLKYGLTEPRLPVPQPKLSYVAVDIETTGLNPDTCQILELGAVFEDWSQPMAKLPTFHRYIAHNTVTGDPFALQMNATCLKKIATRTPGDLDFCLIQDLFWQFRQWLQECGWYDKITPAGKNFANFDYQFLKKCGFNIFLHRTLDPTTLYWQPEDEKLPDMKTCLLRAGMSGHVAHTALEDALSVVHLIRRAVKHLPSNPNQ